MEASSLISAAPESLSPHAPQSRERQGAADSLNSGSQSNTVPVHQAPNRASGSSMPPLMRVDSVALPLRFILSGLAALLLGIGSIVARPDVLATYHYNQWVVAVTHIFTLGWITSVIMGAMYQLVPVALETKLHSARLARGQFLLFIVGWPGMVAAFWIWDIPCVAIFGSITGISIAFFIYNISRSLCGVPRWNVVALGIASSLAWLALAVVAGLFIALSKVFGWSWLDPIAQMHAHAHLGAVGFFLMMLVAVSYKLVPMFALSELRSRTRAACSVALVNGGLAASTLAIVAAPRWRLVAATVCVTGFLLFGIELAAIVRARKRRHLDAALKQFLVAVSLLVPCCIIALVLSWPGLPASQLTTQLENVYGVLGIVGVLTMAIVGMLYKIVPFLVWYFSYSRHIGRSKVPSLANLSSTRLQQLGFVLFVPGLAGLCGGALLQSEPVVRWSGVILLSSIAVFLINVGMMLAHLRHPQLQPLGRHPGLPLTAKNAGSL